MESKAAVEQVVRWMREHLDQEISMEEMAEKAGVSPFHFLRTFYPTEPPLSQGVSSLLKIR
jgi:transcriptional regulator GlxA family with amidase domain